MSSSSSSSVEQLKQYINAGMAVAYGLLYFGGVPLFVYFRAREPIRSRGWLLSVLQMTAALIDVILRTLSYTMVTCGVDTWRSIWLLPLWVYPYFIRVFVLWYNFSLQNVLLLRQTETRKGKIILWIQAHPWVTSVFGQLLLYFIVLACSTVIALALYFGSLARITADCTVPYVADMNLFQGSVAIIFLMVSLYLLWGVNDAYLIKAELIYTLAVGLPIFVVWAFSSTFHWAGFANSGFFVDICQVLFILGTIYMPLYGTRLFGLLLMKRHKLLTDSQGEQHTVSSLSGSDDEVALILGDDVLRSKLTDFMIQSWAIENLLFLDKTREYAALPATERGPLAKKVLVEFIREGLFCLLS